jgi:hypothetical protein
VFIATKLRKLHGKYLGFPDFLGNSVVLERNLLEEWVPIQREKVAAISRKAKGGSMGYGKREGKMNIPS